MVNRFWVICTLTIMGYMTGCIILPQPVPEPDPPPTPEKELTCSISLQSGHLQGNVTVDIELRNSTGQDIRYFDRYNPFSNFDEEFFEITREGTRLNYYGFIAKYEDPDLDDMAIIKDGETKVVSYNLSDYYDFYRGGVIEASPTISLDILESDVPSTTFDDARFIKKELKCNSINFEISSAVQQTGLFTPPCSNGFCPARVCHRYGPGFPRTECQPIINQDCKANFSEQKIHTLHRSTDIPPVDTNTPSFKAFFGDLNAQQIDFVESNIKKINDKFQNGVMKYGCFSKSDFRCRNFSGTSEVVAYVIPSDDYPDIYLCPLFYNAPLNTGYDSKIGTLIHEASHFRPNGTFDHVYGVQAAKELAKKSPDKAIRNADNYQYFYESSR